jgi:hypothetical protein
MPQLDLHPWGLFLKHDKNTPVRVATVRVRPAPVPDARTSRPVPVYNEDASAVFSHLSPDEYGWVGGWLEAGEYQVEVEAPGKRFTIMPLRIPQSTAQSQS